MQSIKKSEFSLNPDLTSAVSLLFFVLYKILLDISYITILVPIYGYSGFSLQFSPVTVAVGFTMAMGIFLCLPKKMTVVSDFILTGIALLSVIPYTTYYSFGGGSIEFMIMTFLFFVTVLALVRLTPMVSIPSFSQKNADIILSVVLWVSAGYIIVRCISAVGLSSLSFDFSTVYVRRAAYKASGVAGDYMMTWSGNSIFPCSIAYFLYRKKYINVGIAALTAAFLFSVSGMKSILFGSVMVFAVFFLFKLKNKMTLLSFLFFVVAVVSMICFYFFEEIIPFSYTLRRLGFLPAKISNQHFEFFLKEGPIQLGNSIFSSVVHYPYDKDPADVIGALYYISGETHANSGVFSDGFTNFGYIGVFLWAVIFAFLMKIQDVVSYKKPYFVVCGCFALYITIFTNSALFTTMMTHGFIITVLITALIPATKINEGETT